MQRYAGEQNERMMLRKQRRRSELRARDRSRPRDTRPANGTYRDIVAKPQTPAVARARFAVFVARALDDARSRGMTDREVARVSGVATSTFHRWRQGETKGLPKLPQVRAFCEATGASVEEAMRVLGMTDSAPEATPEPPLPRDVRIIMRRLGDPNTPDAEREFIRMTLQMLAARAAEGTRAEGQARDSS